MGRDRSVIGCRLRKATIRPGPDCTTRKVNLK